MADLYSFQNLWRQYRNCRRNKRNTFNALAFEVDAEAQLLQLQGELRAHAYRPGRSICFVTPGPKPREVFAANFRDRVVHHLLVAQQERVFEPRFIHDSYACRVGKGTLAASDRLMHFLRQVTANGHRGAWAIKLDVATFFPSIHKLTLFEIVRHAIRDPEILWLTRTLLFHDPTMNYRFRSLRRGVSPPGTLAYPLPPRKSLFSKSNERGLPIGNLTSQFWGNLYLNEVDQFVKRTLRCRCYVRYVDDMILLAERPEALLEWREQIDAFLRERLTLALRVEPAEPFPVKRGVDFVGWRTWWSHRVPRRLTVGNVHHRLHRFERAHVRPAYGGLGRRTALRTGVPATGIGRVRGQRLRGVERLQATVASYSGHLRHGAAWHEWTAIWAKYPCLPMLFEQRGWAITERWAARRMVRRQRFGAQYGELIRHAPSACLIFLHVGRFVEFYGPQRLMAESALGLERVYLPRGGYAFAAGFPRRWEGHFATRALQAGLAVVVARPDLSGSCVRLPTELVSPQTLLKTAAGAMGDLPAKPLRALSAPPRGDFGVSAT